MGTSFTASATAGATTYFACVDKNANGNFADAGEQGSAILTVTNTCAGPLSVVLNPSSTGKLSPVSPFGGGLGSCSGKNLNFKLGSCNSGTWVSNCSASSIGCTGTSFNSPNAFGSFRYSGCIDINGDGDTNDAGENATATLSVSSMCSANIALTLTPNTVARNGLVAPSSTGLGAQCAGFSVEYRNGSCAGQKVSNCSAGAVGCTGAAFTGPGLIGTSTYFACIDANGDGDFGDFGEFASAPLSVVGVCAGPLTMALNPSSTGTASPVSPSGSGLDFCSGKNLNFRLGSCNSGTWVSNCSVGAAGCTGSNFNSPSAFATYLYAGCVDLNNDGDTNDAGENATATLSVIPVCSASIVLTLSPNSTTRNASVTPSASGINSVCSGRNVEFHNASCVGQKVSNCTAGVSGCTGLPFIAPGLEGITTYYGCIDTNNDGDFGDPGENSPAQLAVNVCFGSVALTLTPATSVSPVSVVPSSSGLTNCTGKTVEYRNGTCAGPMVSTCVSGSTGCAGPGFTSPGPLGSYPYYACINKNNANGFADPGEQGLATFSVGPVCSQTPECDVCLSNSTGSPCQCGSECNSQFCRPTDDTCADCTTNADCTSPPDACTQEQGQCIAGACVYPTKTTNRPDCCSCSGAAQCLAGVCNSAMNCSNSALCGGSGGGGGGGGSCNSVEPLANCGGASCPVCVVGVVTSYTGVAQQGATTKYDSTLTYLTDAVGFYFFYNIALGSHVLQAIPAAPWVPTTVTRNLHRAINSVDLVVGIGSSGCEADCTLAGSTACVASCDGTNGCSFATATVKATCDGLQKGFIRDIGGGNQVVCCSGAISPDVNIQSIARVNGTNVITVTRNVFYAGKLVKMKIVVFN